MSLVEFHSTVRIGALSPPGYLDTFPEHSMLEISGYDSRSSPYRPDGHIRSLAPSLTSQPSRPGTQGDAP